MTTKLSNLVVFEKGEMNMESVITKRQATVADLVAALIAEGGEIREAEPDERVSLGDIEDVKPGRYLVFPIPAEEET